MSKEFKIRNKGQICGKVKVNEKNVRKFILLCIAGVSLTSVACSKTNKDSQEDAIVTEYSYRYEPTYEVLYTVKLNDNLSSIVFSYESDVNKAYNIIDKIVFKNKNIENKNSLRDGMVITLYGVPESKLSYFGYSSDYSLIDPIYEIDDRREFIDYAITFAYVTDESQNEYDNLVAKIDDLKSIYQDYKMKADSQEKEQLRDYLLEAYRDLCDDVKDYVGLNFESYKTAYPIPENNKQNNKESEEYGLG